MRSTSGIDSRYGSRRSFSDTQFGQISGKPTGQANPDLVRLTEQMDDVDNAITSLGAEIRQKTARFEVEMKNIQDQIRASQACGQTDLEEMDVDHKREIETLEKQQEAELEDLHTKLDKVLKSRSASVARKNDTKRIQKEAVIAQLKHQLELMRIQRDADGFSKTVSTQQDQIEEQKKELELQAQVEILDAEVAHITTSRNDDVARVQMKIDETTKAFEARNKEQLAKIQKYKSEIAKRKEQYEDQIKALRAQGDLEKTQLENALRAANEKIASLRQLHNKLQDTGSQEHQAIQSEIAELQDAIEHAKQKEEEQMEEIKEQIADYRAAMREKVAIEQEVISLREEIDQIKKQNQEMRKECSRIDNMQYSSRISRYRSALH